MPSEVAAGHKVTLVGDPADLRRCLDKVDELLPKAKPALERWDELTPRQQRKFENVDASHAPLILRMLPPLTREVDRDVDLVTIARPRERKARGASTSSRASPDDSDLPLAVIAPEAFRAAVERALGFPIGAP